MRDLNLARTIRRHLKIRGSSCTITIDALLTEVYPGPGARYVSEGYAHLVPGIDSDLRDQRAVRGFFPLKASCV